ncbi:hypothetical protein COW46_03290 [Candidatus Gracilibacteria bacterium CG17_big_fil_post_rev_8_21_14_2_50_48_13]|nr:MAG: hypothetical protein COW46_03290 [Candidatus Gracilibacteria bacterium CG17_big_fil_post_rev_8_21_14_2_50_48_13]
MALFQFINAATTEKSVVTYSDSAILHVTRWDVSGREAEHVLPAMMEGATAVGATLADLDQLTVVHGPGSFTGLRVAVTVANMLWATYPHIALCPVTAGVLLAVADHFSAPRYVFATYASDVFLFDGDGVHKGRVSGPAFTPEMGDAGQLVSTIAAHEKVRPVALEEALARHDVLMQLHEYVTPASGQLLPFYAKDANITTPKHHAPDLQHGQDPLPSV